MQRDCHTEALRTRITDVYLITMLGVFPLFLGPRGYENITEAKFFCFTAATGLYFAVLFGVSLWRNAGWGKLDAAQWTALILLAALLFSWLCSPFRKQSFLGAGRFDGLLTNVLYALEFLCVSRFGHPKRLHAIAFAGSISLCCGYALLQLAGLDPLGFFPGNLNYYDSGLYYSGAYLGSIGNTNILDAALCLALPLFLTLFVCGGRNLYLLPLGLGSLVEVRAGGSGATVAYVLCAMVAMPLLFTDLRRLHRGLLALSVILLAGGLAIAYHPVYVRRLLTIRWAFSRLSLWLLAFAGISLMTALCLRGKTFLPTLRLRKIFLMIDAMLLALGIGTLWFWPDTTGTIYELRETLLGRAQDSFGSSRVRIWRACLALIRERPLLGGGPGTLPLRLDIQFSRYVTETGKTLTAFVDNAHNIYLGFLVNCGALGLTAYLGVLGVAVRNGLRRLASPMGTALLLSVLCGMVHGFFGLGICLSEPLFWALLGLLAASGD